MKPIQKIAALVLVALLAAAAYGIFRTRPPAVTLPGTSTPTVTTGGRAVPNQPAVDQTPLKAAQELAALVTLPEERPLAQQALRIADHSVDLAFTNALHEVTSHPPALSPEAKEIQTRLQNSEKALTDDQAKVAQLTAADAKATPDKKDALDDQLELAKAQQELDQDEVDDAKQDLIRAGGDPQDRIQEMVREHEASAHSTETVLANAPAPVEERGLIHRFEQWMALHKKQLLLWRAKAQTEATEQELAAKHNALDAEIRQQQSGAPTSSQAPAETAATPSPSAPPAKPAAGTHPQLSRDEAAALVKATKQRSARQKRLATFDKRIDDEKDLADVYTKWIGVVAAQQRMVLNHSLRGIVIILAIALIGLFFDGWIARLLARTSLDRRQMETLRAVTRVSLQVLGVLLILLVIFGPPPNLGTFLGLAGAGLTVALKDFIVGFIGWFVLMGKNGIRLGDWVEINGVTGEVVELGMFHTVLLETGNWTDSGHPTGRRVTFTNSFAIEGHYFNFSTSGQWLWDELQVVVPSGVDPYPVVEAVQKKVIEATAESARQAEREWEGQARSRDLKALSAAPAINVKPVVGGVEIAVRYITQAHERYQLRARLNQTMVDLLGPKATAAPKASEEKPMPA
jgi:small-conductance mechanosensitive channel